MRYFKNNIIIFLFVSDVKLIICLMVLLKLFSLICNYICNIKFNCSLKKQIIVTSRLLKTLLLSLQCNCFALLGSKICNLVKSSSLLKCSRLVIILGDWPVGSIKDFQISPLIYIWLPPTTIGIEFLACISSI